MSVGRAGFFNVRVMFEIMAERIAEYCAAGCTGRLIGAGRVIAAVLFVVKPGSTGFAACADVPVVGLIVAIALRNVSLAELERAERITRDPVIIEVVVCHELLMQVGEHNRMVALLQPQIEVRVAGISLRIVYGNRCTAVDIYIIAVRICYFQQVYLIAGVAVLYRAVLGNIRRKRACGDKRHRAACDVNITCVPLIAGAVSYHIISAGILLDKRNHAVFDIYFAARAAVAAADYSRAIHTFCINNGVFYGDVFTICVLTAADGSGIVIGYSSYLRVLNCDTRRIVASAAADRCRAEAARCIDYAAKDLYIFSGYGIIVVVIFFTAADRR